MANFEGKVRTIICELSRGNYCSHKHHWQVFLGQMRKGLVSRAWLCLPPQNSSRHACLLNETRAPRHSYVSSPPTSQPLTPKGALPIRVEHDVHEECGNGRQRVGVQAGDTEPVARARQWVDDRPLDCEGTKTRDAEARRRGALWTRWRPRKRGEVCHHVLWGGPAAGPVRPCSCCFSSLYHHL